MELDRPLAALGFDSLMAVELRNRIWAELDVEIGAAQVLASEGVDALARLVDAAVTSGDGWEEFSI